MWMTKTFDMHTYSGVIVLQVTFEGVVGSTAFSDIAIDDVEFQENTKCTTTAETLGKTTGNNEILISAVFFYNHYNTPIFQCCNTYLLSDVNITHLTHRYYSLLLCLHRQIKDISCKRRKELRGN